MKNEDSQLKKVDKKKANSFRIDNEWFNDDGSHYTESESLATKKTDDSMFYMEKIKQLQEELKQTKEVFHFTFYICEFRMP